MSRTTDELDRAGVEGAPSQKGLPGAVATSHPVAVDAAVDVLEKGGNAVDAAVAAALVLGVVEPMSTGLGGDMFALAWMREAGELFGLNGSGAAPAAATLESLASRGHARMPEEGILPVTVPGALDGHARLLARLGTRELGALLEPAVRAARDGFAVTPVVARDWARTKEALERGHGTGVYLPGGRAPAVGETFRQPELAETLTHIAKEGVDLFYRGELGARIAATARELGGFLAAEDLSACEGEWVTPLEASYRGHPVFELPPNGQGLVVLEALRILEAFPLSDMAADERTHVLIEALKLAFEDAFAHVADPRVSPVPVERLLGRAHIEHRVNQLGERARPTPRAHGTPGDTAYVAVVDRHGNACSLIHSLYMPFGARVVVPGTGICLHNRGALFSTDPDHPNALAPGKRPYHTIIPSMVFRSGRPWLVLGVVGGFQQPQAQVQILTQMIDLGRDPEGSVAAPRFRFIDGAMVGLETGFPPTVAESLRARGHVLVPEAPGALTFGFGGAQLIEIDPHTGARRGATDPRKDGRFRTTA